MTAIEPYTIDVPESILNDLNKRLENTRWSQSPDLGWDGGMHPDYLRALCDYWRQGYDWRSAERKLNGLPQFRTEIEGTGIHFVYERGKGRPPDRDLGHPVLQEPYSGRENSWPMSSDPITTPPSFGRSPSAWRGNSGRPMKANSNGKTQPVSSVNTSTLRIAGLIWSLSLAGGVGTGAHSAVPSGSSGSLI
jgi:hypothetical protein